MEIIFWLLIITLLIYDCYNLYQHYNDDKTYAKFNFNEFKARHSLTRQRKQAKILKFEKKDKK